MDTASSTPSVDSGAPVTNTSDVAVPFVAPASDEPTHRMGSAGSVLAVLLIVFLLVVGAFYVWGQRISERNAEEVVPAIAQ